MKLCGNPGRRFHVLSRRVLIKRCRLLLDFCSWAVSAAAAANWANQAKHTNLRLGRRLPTFSPGGEKEASHFIISATHPAQWVNIQDHGFCLFATFFADFRRQINLHRDLNSRKICESKSCGKVDLQLSVMSHFGDRGKKEDRREEARVKLFGICFQRIFCQTSVQENGTKSRGKWKVKEGQTKGEHGTLFCNVPR